MRSFPPAVLFVYNRPAHTSRTLRALARNHGAERTELIVFADGPRGETDRGLVNETRERCRRAAGFAGVRVVERDRNLGLAGSVIQGVTEALAEVEAVVVLEDDLLTSPYFLRYMRGALHAYGADPRILSVGAFLPPRPLMPRVRDFRDDVWLSLRNWSFGWGVWRDRWRRVNWLQAEEDGFATASEHREGFAAGGADLPRMLDRQLAGDLDSWAVRFSYAQYRLGGFSLLPRDSYVKPIGYDGSGVHARPSPVAWLSTTRHAVAEPVFPPEPQPHPGMQAAMRRYARWHLRAARWLGR